MGEQPQFMGEQPQFPYTDSVVSPPAMVQHGPHDVLPLNPQPSALIQDVLPLKLNFRTRPEEPNGPPEKTPGLNPPPSKPEPFLLK